MSKNLLWGPKPRSLSLRLDEKTRFIVDLVTIGTGITVTAFVEQAIRDAGNRTPLGPPYGPNDHWSTFWDSSEGVRTLRVFSNPVFRPTAEDDELWQFALEHWQFFFDDPEGRNPNRKKVDVLWPHFEDYLAIWSKTKAKDPWAAGLEMKAVLKAARLDGPLWPAFDRLAE